MVGDVNIFLTDPTDLTLAELEIMIAGESFLQNQPVLSLLHVSLRFNTAAIRMFPPFKLMTFLLLRRARSPRQRHREGGDAHDDELR